MILNYKIIIDSPTTHQVQVVMTGKRAKGERETIFFLPRWSPGSYLIREYSRHLLQLKAENSKGERLHFKQTDISHFTLDWEASQLLASNILIDETFTISYMIYCHELTVRTSHVDLSHAFLHLPTLLMGVEGKTIDQPTLELRFPPSWSKVTTGLTDISPKREIFLYTANNYDELIDSPIEIGCHETDGFMVDGIPHELAYYGGNWPHKENLKADIKRIVEYISNFMGGLPYKKYVFINHFVPGLYGGLEHLNSTALHFCSFSLSSRKDYLGYLALVSHEYFHTWNVKRIRPKELGPFNYTREATTTMLWLAEGLTSFMDELFIYKAGLISVEEYLEMQKTNFERYFNTPGRRFHSLEDSSFNAWIKLYRPDENSQNSSISYYLKGGLVFFALHLLFLKSGKKIDHLVLSLWEYYKKNPNTGITSNEIFAMVEDIGGNAARVIFEKMVTTTEEIDFETLAREAGIGFDWEKSKEKPTLGFDADFSGDRVLVKSVPLDGPAFRAGVNAGDEIIAIEGLRVLKDRFNNLGKFLQVNGRYTLTLARLSKLIECEIIACEEPPKLRALVAVDEKKFKEAFLS